MKKIIALMGLSLVLFFGCTQVENGLAGIVNPLVGTWTNTTLGVTTAIVLNANADFTVTTTILGVGTTTNGTWTSTDTTVTRTWSDGSTEVWYYSFNANSTELTISSSPTGISTTYTES